MFTQSQYLPDSYFDNPNDFLWPIDRDIGICARDTFITSIIDFYKSQKDFSPFVQYYPVLCMYWSAHILQSYNAATLRKSNNRNFPLNDPVQNAIVNDLSIPEPIYISQLEKGIKDIKTYLKPVRFLKHLLYPNSDIKRIPSMFTNFDKDIVVTTTGNAISCHARQINQNVIYHNQCLWFYPLEDLMALDYYYADKDSDLLWSFVEKCFGNNFKIIDQSSIKDWFLNIFRKSLVLCHAYTQRLEDQGNKLPKNLWIGTGSALWDRILKNAVYKNGGHVTGHDHGAGVGHLISKSRTLAECFACHDFATFGNEDQFLQSIYKPFLLNPAPRPIRISGEKDSLNSDIQSRIGQKVLIMPSAPESSIPRFIGAAMEPVQADFLNRLFLQLKKDGYKVYIKPHPELKPLINDNYFINNGGHILRNSLKEAYDLCDVVIFQHIHSTTFKEAFEHGKHICVVDMRYDQWEAKAYKDVKQRCSLISAYYDEQNKIQIDWESLQEKIERSRYLKNDEFIKRFFS